MARSFTQDDGIGFNVGALSWSGASTLAAICKVDADSSGEVFFRAYDAGFTAGLELARNSSNKIEAAYRRSGGTTFVNNIDFTTSDGWCLIAVAKATGTVSPRFAKIPLSTLTPVFGTPATTAADQDSGVTSVDAYFGDKTLLCVGAWDKKLTDDEIKLLAVSLRYWLSANRCLHLYDQDAVTQKIIDITGKGANESVRAGTSVVQGPPGFSYDFDRIIVNHHQPIYKAVTQISEVDLSQTIADQKAYQIGASSESDLARLITWSPKIRLLQKTDETDLARNVIRNPVHKILSRSDETSLAQPVGHYRQALVVKVLETGIPQSITCAKVYAMPKAYEIDIASAMANRVVMAQASESETASTFSHTKLHNVSASAEADLARTITPVRYVALSRASDGCLAQPVTRVKRVGVERAVSSETSSGILRQKLHAIARASITEQAIQFFNKVKRHQFSWATDVEIATAITRVRIPIALGRAQEQDTSGIVRPGQIIVAQQIVEGDIANIAVQVKRRLIVQMASIHLAQSITSTKYRSVSQMGESDLARQISVAKVRSLSPTNESSTASLIIHYRLWRLQTTSTIEVAIDINRRKLKFIDGQAQETEQANSIGHYRTAVLGRAIEQNLSQAQTHRKLKYIVAAHENGRAIPLVRMLGEKDLHGHIDPILVGRSRRVAQRVN